LRQRKEDKMTGFEPTAYWKVLNPIKSLIPEPTNISKKLHPPTVPEEDMDHVVPKHNYSQCFEREEFGGTVEEPARYRNGHIKRDANGDAIYEKRIYIKGGVHSEWMKKHRLGLDSTPQDWFRAFLPNTKADIKFTGPSNKVCIEKWTEYTNKPSYLANAGQPGGIYPMWKPFT